MQNSIERYRNPQVLLLEDDESHRLTLAEILAEEGYNIIACCGAHEALERLRQDIVSVAVVDLNLPEISNKELLEQLSSFAERIPIIIHTGYSSYESARDALNLGAFAYVEKGRDPDMLVRAVHRAFQVRLKHYAEELEQAVSQRTGQLQQAYEALRLSEARYRSIFETAACLITSVDEQGVLVDCNERIEQVLGYQRHEVLGQSMGKLIHPDCMEKARASLRTVIQAGYAYNQEYVMQRKDGALIDVCINSSALKDAQGRFLRTICLVEDITERKQAEAKVMEYQDQLKSLASQLTLTEERLRRHVATQLHDMISQSLAMTKLEVASLRQGSTDAALCARLDYIEEMLSQTLTDSRHLTSTLSYPTLDVLGFETAVEKWLEDEIHAKYDLATLYEDDGQDKPLDEDVRAVLFRGVRELLMNVIKHARARQVCVSLTRRNNHIMVSIQDDGIGSEQISPQDYGFGLMSIQEALHRLAGELMIETEPGCGFKAMLMAPLQGETTQACVIDEALSHRKKGKAVFK